MGLAPDPQYFEDKSCGCCTVDKTVVPTPSLCGSDPGQCIEKTKKGKEVWSCPLKTTSLPSKWKMLEWKTHQFET